jgi:hypothetical protein
MPPLKQSAGLLQQSFADPLRFLTAFGDLLKLADQMRPAQLPP